MGLGVMKGRLGLVIGPTIGGLAGLRERVSAAARGRYRRRAARGLTRIACRPLPEGF